jgi:hypothetical protein
MGFMTKEEFRMVVDNLNNIEDRRYQFIKYIFTKIKTDDKILLNYVSQEPQREYVIIVLLDNNRNELIDVFVSQDTITQLSSMNTNAKYNMLKALNIDTNKYFPSFVYTKVILEK